MEGSDNQHIERDMPECEEPMRDKEGKIVTRWNTDYWKWRDMCLDAL